MTEEFGTYDGGGGGNRTPDEAPIPEQDQEPASAEAGTEAVLRLSAGEQFVHFDEMTWPLPDEDLEWRVRYQTTFGGSHHRVASLLAAYAHLIAMPERKRRKVIKAIRTGQRMKLAASALLQAQP